MTDFSLYTNRRYSNAAKTQMDVTRPDGVRTTITPTDPSPALWDALTAGNVADFVPAAPTKEQLSAFANLQLSLRLSEPRAYTSSDGTTIQVDATQATRTDLIALQKWGGDNPTATQKWVANDGTITPVTGASYSEIADQVGAHALALYDKLGMIVTAIQSGEITTFTAISNVQWPA